MTPTLSRPQLTPTQINYAIVCLRKLWFFSHSINMEKQSELVRIGKLIHEDSYSREKKEISINGIMKIDFANLNEGIIHEVKKSNRVKDAHKMQLLYILYYLKQIGADGLKGEIDYPRLKKKTRVILDEENQSCLEKIMEKAENIISQNKPPKAEYKRICKKCSYYELCFC